MTPTKRRKTMNQTKNNEQGGCCGGDTNHEHNKLKKEKE
jgi:hypothetical protein